MARAFLQVNTTDVRSLADNLHTVKGTLEQAQATSDGLAGMVGHERLACVIDDFSSKWDDRRTELVDQMNTMHEMATGVADGFETMDDELAKAITAPPTEA